MKKIILFLTLFMLVPMAWANADTADGNTVTIKVTGVLYEDIDGNGQRGSEEPPIKGIKVSNGIDIVNTDELGHFAFEMPLNKNPCIFPIIPKEYEVLGNTYVCIGESESSDQCIAIGLRKRSNPPPKQFTIVQISDVHVGSHSRVSAVIEDVEEINRLTPSPALVVATGDLVHNGKNTAQYEGYVAAMSKLNLPLINVIGNHDYQKGGDNRTKNWEKFMGSRYFSFDYGRYHLLCLDSVNYDDVQKAWAEKDLSLVPKDQPILVFLHYLPTNEQLDFFAHYNTKAVFSGHWHGTREARYKGIMNINSAPLAFGGIDRTSRGFRVINFDGDSIQFDYRVGGIEKHIAIVSPQSDSTVSLGQISVVVNAYDTDTQVDRVTVAIRDAASPNELPRKKSLQREGNWSWFGVTETGKVGKKLIEIVAHDAHGKQWSMSSVFYVNEKIHIKVKPGEDWPMFHGNAQNTGVAKDAIKTPLLLAWVTNSGGTVNIGSPVVANGRVYIGTLFTHNFDECGVACIDAQSGKLIWHSKTDSSIKHSPSVGEGIVYAASVAGTLYAFNAETGSTIWTAPLGSDNVQCWDIRAPKFVDGVVYAGRGYFAAFNSKTGAELWKADSVDGNWWPTAYASPAIGGDRIYFGSTLPRSGLFALERKTGKRLWHIKKHSGSPVLAGGKLYCRYGNGIAAIEAETGKILWKVPDNVYVNKGNSGASDETGCPAVTTGDDARLYIGGANGKMMAFSAADGQALGNFLVERGIASMRPYQRNERTITSSPAVSGDLLIFGGTDGYLYVLDRITMKERQKFYIGAPIASSPVISGNAIFIAAYDGNVYAFATVEIKE